MYYTPNDQKPCHINHLPTALTLTTHSPFPADAVQLYSTSYPLNIFLYLALQYSTRTRYSLSREYSCIFSWLVVYTCSLPLFLKYSSCIFSSGIITVSDINYPNPSLFHKYRNCNLLAVFYTSYNHQENNAVKNE